MLAIAAIAGGFLAAAAPAQASEPVKTAAAMSTITQVEKAADVAPQASRVYRGSFAYLSTCDTYGRSWVASGAARWYNCGLDSRYPGLPWSLYTYH